MGDMRCEMRDGVAHITYRTTQIAYLRSPIPYGEAYYDQAKMSIFEADQFFLDLYGNLP